MFYASTLPVTIADDWGAQVPAWLGAAATVMYLLLAWPWAGEAITAGTRAGRCHRPRPTGARQIPVAPQPGHDINAAAEHRMRRAVRHLKTIGCQASGLISDQDLVKAVAAETRRHRYDEVILATGRQGGTRLARSLRLDPVR